MAYAKRCTSASLLGEAKKHCDLYIQKKHLAGAAPGALKWKSTEWDFRSSINPPLQI